MAPICSKRHRTKARRSFSHTAAALPRALLIKQHLATSGSQLSQVFMFDNGDPEMHRANKAARVTIHYF